jgi:hypothetical protein
MQVGRRCCRQAGWGSGLPESQRGTSGAACAELRLLGELHTQPAASACRWRRSNRRSLVREGLVGGGMAGSLHRKHRPPPPVTPPPPPHTHTHTHTSNCSTLTRSTPPPRAPSTHTQPQAVREAFLAQDALAAVVGMLAEPLGRHPRMNDQDAALVQLVIAFLKCEGGCLACHADSGAVLGGRGGRPALLAFGGGWGAEAGAGCKAPPAQRRLQVPAYSGYHTPCLPLPSPPPKKKNL